MEKTLLKEKAPLLLLLYLLISYMVTGILLLILAFTVFRFHLGESVVNIVIIAIYSLSTFVGGYAAGKKMKTHRFLWGFLMGLAYFVVLVLVSLLVNHSLKDFSGNFFTVLTLCMGGGMLGGMLG